MAKMINCGSNKYKLVAITRLGGRHVCTAEINNQEIGPVPSGIPTLFRCQQTISYVRIRTIKSSQQYNKSALMVNLTNGVNSIIKCSINTQRQSMYYSLQQFLENSAINRHRVLSLFVSGEAHYSWPHLKQNLYNYRI